jgi:hypothetical protein
VTDSDLVVLKGGCAVPASAVLLCLELERRGCGFELEGDGFLVGPKHLITDDDRAQLRAQRDAVLAVLRYCEGVTDHA